MCREDCSGLEALWEHIDERHRALLDAYMDHWNDVCNSDNAAGHTFF